MASFEGPVVVADSRHTQVTFYRGVGKRLLVSFSPAGRHARPGEFWSKSVSLGLKIPTLSFDAKANNWYPTEDVEHAMQRVRETVPLTEFDRVITYGYSMGGYGALKHGVRVGASETVAMSPQISIDPAHVGDFDGRFAQDFDPDIHGDMAIRRDEVCPRTTVLFDPLIKIDAEHAKRARALAGARSLLTPGFAHNAIAAYTSTGLSKVFIQTIMDGHPELGPSLRRLLRMNRHKSLVYWHVLGLIAKHRGRPDRARQIWQRGLSLFPESDNLKRELAGADTFGA